MRSFTAYVHAAPQKVWDAMTNPAITRLYFDFMEGFMAVDSSWQPGEAITYRTGDGTAQIEGQILAVEPGRRLVTSFSLLYEPDARREAPSRLSWEITPMGEVCKLTVTHDGVNDAGRTAEDINSCMPAILNNLKILLETGKPRLIKEIVVDCAAPAQLAAFWLQALGYSMQGPLPSPDDSFVAIVDLSGVGPELGFQQVPEAKAGKNRLHLDLHVVDRSAEVERLERLGAKAVQSFDGWTVMTDPEGNEFCVVSG